MLIGLLFAAASLGLLVRQADAAEVGTYVKLAVRKTAESYDVGLQHFDVESETWSDVESPQQFRVARTAQRNYWYRSSPVTVSSFQRSIEISSEYRQWTPFTGPGRLILLLSERNVGSNCGWMSVQLQAADVVVRTADHDRCDGTILRRATDLTDFGALAQQEVRIRLRLSATLDAQFYAERRTADGGWSRIGRDIVTVPNSNLSERWWISQPLAVPTPEARVVGSLGEGVLSSEAGAIQLQAGDRSYSSNCGYLRFTSTPLTVLVSTLDEHCQELVPLATLCGNNTWLLNHGCDRQQNHLYHWEHRYTESVAELKISQSQARAIADAVFSDFLPRTEPPAVSFASVRYPQYVYRSHEIILNPEGQTLGTTLHEVGHALVVQGGVHDPGHGSRFAALMMYLYQRYTPHLDVESMRQAASDRGVSIAAQTPLWPSSNDGIGVVYEQLCSPNRISAPLCDALSKHPLR